MAFERLKVLLTNLGWLPPPETDSGWWDLSHRWQQLSNWWSPPLPPPDCHWADFSCHGKQWLPLLEHCEQEGYPCLMKELWAQYHPSLLTVGTTFGLCAGMIGFITICKKLTEDEEFFNDFILQRNPSDHHLGAP